MKAICERCTPDRCHEPPTPQSPFTLLMEGGKKLRFTSCPRRACSELSKQVVRLAGFAEQGHLPLAGGALDQSQQFLVALDYVRAVENQIRQERKSHG
jgi:hypothetical protein